MSQWHVTNGIYAPVVTPFDVRLQPDLARYVRHCKWLVAQGVGLAIFGTNSEANSLSTGEKKALLDTILAEGLPANRLMPGTGCCAFPDTVELTRYALARGVTDVLMLPPFYYKNVSDDGLFRSYAEIIERVADERLRIYLYHIPAVSQVPITLPLIERLMRAYPGTVAGVKDSSGDMSNTQAILDRFAPAGFNVFAGSESFLLATMRGGGAGCITATGNVNPAAIVRLFKSWQGADADQQQKRLDGVRSVFGKYPMIAALKASIAMFGNDSDWEIVRPPLTSLSDIQKGTFEGELSAIDFRMPALMS